MNMNRYPESSGNRALVFAMRSACSLSVCIVVLGSITPAVAAASTVHPGRIDQTNPIVLASDGTGSARQLADALKRMSDTRRTIVVRPGSTLPMALRRKSSISPGAMSARLQSSRKTWSARRFLTGR